MRFVEAEKRKRTINVELTSMIDVVFLLIIFFMTTSQFAKMTRAEVSLPQEAGEQDPTPVEAGLVINITEDGKIIINNAPPMNLVELEYLVQQEIAKYPDRSAHQLKLLIRADKNAESARLNQVVTLLQSLNIGSARIATEVPK